MPAVRTVTVYGLDVADDGSDVGVRMVVEVLDDGSKTITAFGYDSGPTLEECRRRLSELAILSRAPYRKPPRTGYYDERRIYHPAPDSVWFDDHAEGCERCDAERQHPERSGYVKRPQR